MPDNFTIVLNMTSTKISMDGQHSNIVINIKSVKKNLSKVVAGGGGGDNPLKAPQKNNKNSNLKTSNRKKTQPAQSQLESKRGIK